METISLALILLLAVVASGVLARILPVTVPLPLFQIALGFAVAAFGNLGIRLDPDIFFLLFLPPMLFLDAWRIPKEGLLRDKETILELAIGLVVFTVVGVGFLLHWMIPQMPLPVAFALAAILSPTDPIAVTSIAARVPIPRRLLHILEGEALLNDASGLVCMRFAVAAATTGTFSLVDASLTFVWVALGGLAIGSGLTWLVLRGKDWFSRHFGEEIGSQILISLLIPFAAYLLAEHLGCSGILAAVAAGMTMSYVESIQVMAATRVRRSSFWDTLQFAANGIIFVLLGEQLPQIASGAAAALGDAGRQQPLWLVVYVVAVTAALALLRLVWAWTSLRFTLFKLRRKGQTVRRPSWRLVVATSLAGARGTITLAGILTLPFTLDDGSPFPARDLAIFIAAGTILLSLVVASIALPKLLTGLQYLPDDQHREAEDQARSAAAEAAIQAIEKAQHKLSEGRQDADLYASVASRLMELYRQRIDGRAKTGEERAQMLRSDEIERELRLAGLRAERADIYRSIRGHRINQDLGQRLVREIDLQETRLAALS